MKTFVRDIIMIIRSNIANVMTFLNLSFGCLAIFHTFNGQYLIATISIVVATIIDRFDGKVARKLVTSSKFGEELDSLADLVSFGVSPAFLIWSLILIEIKFGIILVIIYISAGALRLARFNCSEDKGVFQGVPITIAGLFMAILSLIIINYRINIVVVAIFMAILSYCMVSTKIRIIKK